MILKYKKTYKFAFKSTFYIVLFSTFLLGILYLFFKPINLWVIFFFLLGLSVFSFYIIQYRVEHFIYKRVQKIYNNVSLLENSPFRNQTITTDMQSLLNDIQTFATQKKIEIEDFKIREEYRREFLGNVSHELKTPLFTIQSYLLTLLDGAMDDKNVRKKYLQRAEKSVERLIHIVKDLDMISKLENGILTIYKEKFNIVEIVRNVFELLEMKALLKNITLTFDRTYRKPIWVMADAERIQQVIMNLILNSIAYGKENGTTEVSIENLTPQKIIVQITDNGEGIEKNNLERVFERFYRVDKSGARSEGGSGLGLAIVKHIIETHNEKIYVESEVGVGSEFSFTLEKSL